MKYKEGDKVLVKIGNTKKRAIIDDIEWDDFKEEYIIDLDCGNWCYVDQIIKKL